MQVCSHPCLARTYNFQCCFFKVIPAFDHVFSWIYSLLSFPCVCVFVCVFAAAILDLLHSGDDVRAGREVQVEPI